MEDLEQVLKDIQDHLAPRLDAYEQAIYFYLLRHTRLIGLDEAVIGFKSARRRLACGIGERGKPRSENTAYEKLQSLQAKGCIVSLDSTRDGRSTGWTADLDPSLLDFALHEPTEHKSGAHVQT